MKRLRKSAEAAFAVEKKLVGILKREMVLGSIVPDLAQQRGWAA